MASHLLNMAPTTQPNANATTTARTPSPTWMYWALPLLALSGLAWYFMGDDRAGSPVTQAPQKLVQTETAQAPPASVGRSEVRYLTGIPAESISIGTYLNRDIYDRTGERLGSVKDVLISSDGRIAAAIVGVGDFLGIGEKEVGIPSSAWQMVRKDNDWRFVVDATRASLQAAPAFVRAGERPNNSSIPYRLINPSPPARQ